jgi:hypothetical protein
VHAPDAAGAAAASEANNAAEPPEATANRPIMNDRRCILNSSIQPVRSNSTGKMKFARAAAAKVEGGSSDVLNNRFAKSGFGRSPNG